MKNKYQTPSIRIFIITFMAAQIPGYYFNIQPTGGEQLTHLLLSFTGLMISYIFGHLLGCIFRSRVPQGKGFEVGLASCIGILILGFTVIFFFPAVRDLRYLRELLSAVFGLAIGFGYSVGRGKVLAA